MTAPTERIRLGISACLLGERVRYDGGHKRDAFLADTLGQYVEWVPVCPETECGLPVPREAMRLVGSDESPRLVTVQTRIDHTERMTSWAARRVRELERENLCGFIFKSKSPSSGMERVKVYDAGGNARKAGIGLFARAFMQHFPLLPVEEEGRMHDPVLRENFIERIFCLKRYRDSVSGTGRLRRRALVEFQTDQKILLMSHSAELMRRMGHLVGRGDLLDAVELTAEYERLLLQTLKLTATVRKNVNALQHMMGHLRHSLSADEKQELLDVIGRYHAGLVPLVVPVTLLSHHVRKHKVEYLSRQVYLNPHPLELKLRNHA